MIVQSSPQIVSDYCTNHSTLRINKTYQRSGQIWPKRAKSALIETIILGYPMPAMYLHQCYDKDARRPYKDLVDGQQRTECIMEFFGGDLVLSKSLGTEGLRGKTLSALEAPQYEAFMSYSLPIFLFTQATESEVREAFRRINSYNAVLNPQEIRHSSFQGEFKWFIHGLTSELDALLLELGVVSTNDAVRMKDTVLLAEICYMAINGIKTTKQEHITKLYEENEDSFEDGPKLRRLILQAFDKINEWRDTIQNTSLAKSYQIAMLALAIMHSSKSLTPLQTMVSGGGGVGPKNAVLERLSALAAALEGASSDEEDFQVDEETTQQDVIPRREQYKEFVRASESKTNTEGHRAVRFRYFMEAVSKKS